MDISSQDSGSSRVILVVDDDLSDLSLMERTLSKAGYTVQTASNCQQALSILQKLIPSVLVFDVGLPGMSGFELCSTLKNDEKLKNVPVVFVSGCDSTENYKTGNLVGGVFFVPKAKGWKNLLNAVSLLGGPHGKSAGTRESVGAGARFPNRRSVRYALVARADLTDPTRGKRITGLTSDISLTGCQIEVASSFRQGDSVEIRITRNGQTFQSMASLVRVQSDRIGVRFDRTAAEQVVIIASWIKQLEAEQRAKLDSFHGQVRS